MKMRKWYRRAMLALAGLFLAPFVTLAASDSYEMRASVTPSSGNAPLTVVVSVAADTPLLCTAFSIDWGDGSAPLQYVPERFDTCAPSPIFTRSFTHTYNPQDTDTATSYTIVVKAGAAPLDTINPVRLVAVVYPEDYTPDTETDTNTQDTQCFINPNLGYAPMEATAYIPVGGTDCGTDNPMRYYVSWGDGATTTEKMCTDDAISYDLLTHTYDTPGTYTATLVRTYQPDAENATTERTTCTVSVKERPVLRFISPEKHTFIPLEEPYRLEVFAAHLPGEIHGLRPKLRFLFLTNDGQAGYIGDVSNLTEAASSTYTFLWTPSTRTCEEDAEACPTPLYPGTYRIVASVIYDICNGDPYCGKEFPIVAATTSAPVEIADAAGTAYGVSDRLYVYPQTAPQAPATVHFTAVLNSDASCLGGTYTLDFGDGVAHTVSYPQGKCVAFATTFTHRYEEPGVYLITLRKNGNPVLYERVAVLAQEAAPSHQLGAVWAAIQNFVRWLFNQ